MTTSEPSRLDRIERILDTLATNQVNERDRRLELREELDLAEQRQRLSDARMNRLEAAHNQFNEQMSVLAAVQQRSQQQLDQLSADVRQLTTDIGSLAIQVEEISTRAEQDRSQAAIDRAEFRSTVQQLLDALRQQYNGNGGRGN